MADLQIISHYLSQMFDDKYEVVDYVGMVLVYHRYESLY